MWFKAKGDRHSSECKVRWTNGQVGKQGKKCRAREGEGGEGSKYLGSKILDCM